MIILSSNRKRNNPTAIISNVNNSDITTIFIDSSSLDLVSNDISILIERTIINSKRHSICNNTVILLSFSNNRREKNHTAIISKVNIIVILPLPFSIALLYWGEQLVLLFITVQHLTIPKPQSFPACIYSFHNLEKTKVFCWIYSNFQLYHSKIKVKSSIVLSSIA